MEQDRRRFPRLKTPVLCRPAGLFLRLFAGRQERPTQDISMGGARIYSDDPVKVGTRLEMELFLPAGSNLVLQAQVAWVEELPPGGPAAFDVGLRFDELKEADKARLETVIAPEE